MSGNIFWKVFFMIHELLFGNFFLSIFEKMIFPEKHILIIEMSKIVLEIDSPPIEKLMLSNSAPSSAEGKLFSYGKILPCSLTLSIMSCAKRSLGKIFQLFSL